MQCPVCNLPLALSERHGVEVDYCPKCRGLWLGRGEIDKIIERASDEPARPPPQPKYGQSTYRHHHDEHNPYYARHPRRKKSFLSDILGVD